MNSKMQLSGTTQISVRRILEKDYKHIPQLNTELGYSFNLQQVIENMKEICAAGRDVIFVAVNINDEAIGYLHLSPYILIYFERAVNILGLVVSNEYRNLGVGKLLLKAAENWSVEQGYKVIRLVSGDKRIDAHRFYLQNGYTFHKTQKNFKKHL
jgi:GNAT superfamily N-acetyltransferase